MNCNDIEYNGFSSSISEEEEQSSGYSQNIEFRQKNADIIGERDENILDESFKIGSKYSVKKNKKLTS